MSQLITQIPNDDSTVLQFAGPGLEGTPANALDLYCVKESDPNTFYCAGGIDTTTDPQGRPSFIVEIPGLAYGVGDTVHAFYIDRKAPFWQDELPLPAAMKTRWVNGHGPNVAVPVTLLETDPVTIAGKQRDFSKCIWFETFQGVQSIGQIQPSDHVRLANLPQCFPQYLTPKMEIRYWDAFNKLVYTPAGLPHGSYSTISPTIEKGFFSSVVWDYLYTAYGQDFFTPVMSDCVDITDTQPLHWTMEGQGYLPGDGRHWYEVGFVPMGEASPVANPFTNDALVKSITGLSSSHNSVVVSIFSGEIIVRVYNPNIGAGANPPYQQQYISGKRPKACNGSDAGVNRRNRWDIFLSTNRVVICETDCLGNMHDILDAPLNPAITFTSIQPVWGSALYHSSNATNHNDQYNPGSYYCSAAAGGCRGNNFRGIYDNVSVDNVTPFPDS